MQCVGSTLIAPLIKRFPTKNLLAGAILVFGVFTAILLIVDATTLLCRLPIATNTRKTNSRTTVTTTLDGINLNGINLIYCVVGIAYGMIELIRRVIPRDIVGGNVQDLQSMDSLVHIFYEVAGASSAFCTALALLPRFGNNYSFIITPICFTLASGIWFCVSNLDFQATKAEVFGQQPSYKAVLGGFWLFIESIWTGANYLRQQQVSLAPAWLRDRSLRPSLPGNGIAPAVARRNLGNSAWSQIMDGGSNFGELLDAGCVFMFTNSITTPIP
ncbi:hypothetical protein V1506DRAFT_572333 [Lipomyces tetrasporus]